MIVQGWGNVASAAALYLAHSGARIVGIIDKEGGLINPEGYDLEAVKHLFIHNKHGNKLVSKDMLSFKKINEQVWDQQADIFIPAAGIKVDN